MEINEIVCLKCCEGSSLTNIIEWDKGEYLITQCEKEGLEKCRRSRRKSCFQHKREKKKHFLKKTVAGAGGKNFINKKMI